jgi:hypothetical protein
MANIRILTKPEEKSSVGTPRRKWEDSIKMCLKNRVWGCRMDSSGSVVGCCERGNEPSGYIKSGELLTSCATTLF